MKQRALILVLALLFSSCAKRQGDIIRITSELPGGQISRSQQSLSLAFSRGVVRPESTNIWTSVPYIAFTPDIPGKFVWQDTATLVFSPDQPFAGDTRFSAKLNTELLTKLSGSRSFEGKDAFEFSTESFRMKSAEFFYDRVGAGRKIGIRANLEFTYAVVPADVEKSIQLTVDGQPLTGITAATSQTSPVVPIEIGTVTQTDKEKKIGVTFSKDLISPETQTRITMESPFVFTLPGIEELKIYGHEFGYDGTTSWITIRTSQEVDSASARQFVTLDPPRAFTLEGDRQTLTIRGRFEPGSTFHLAIRKGLQSVLEAKTRNDYEADIVIGNIKPSFRFTSSGGTYMLLGGQRKVEFRTVNLQKLAVRVSQVFQNNLVFFLDGGRQYDYGYGDDYGDEEGGGGRSPTAKFRYFLGNYGRQLWYDSIPVASVSNQEVSTLFDINPFLRSDYRGFYLVEIASPGEPWRSTAKMISLSNLGVIVKRSGDEALVFVTDLETTQPVPGAIVNLISTNNQTIANMKTDRDGAARFAGFRKLSENFDLKLVTAEAGNDFNFINLADYRVETSRYDVDGRRDSPNLYDSWLYGDRNIYRPGETVHLSGIVRNLGNPLPSQMPVRLKIYNSRGTLVKETQHTLNDEGSFESAYQTSATSPTGTYRFELYTGDNIFLTSIVVSVEDFVPDRLRINLSASKETARPGETIRYEFQALNFFGPPAAGRNFEFEGSFVHIPYVSRQFREFSFLDASAPNAQPQPEVHAGTTDDHGKAAVEFAIPKDITASGLLRARGRVAVFDESGRPVYQIAQTTIYPKDYAIGIQNLGSYYCAPSTPQKLRVIAVDINDKPINGFQARVDLIRYEWHSVLREHPQTHQLRYVSERREINEKSEQITLGAEPVEYTYSAPRTGEYLVRISREGDTGYNQLSFYAYEWGSADVTSFPVDPEARVQMVFNDSVYQPGQRARVLFQTPFSGRMLVTIERNHVYEYRYLDVVNNTASMEFSVKDNYLPNVYVSAVLFRKIKDINIPLLAGHGFAPLMVQKPSNRLPVEIVAPEKIRSKTKQTVTIRTAHERDVVVTLAAVDEGICQVKNYKTPDPYGYFYSKKALETETFDFFKALLPEPAKSSPGGSDQEVGKRVNPLGVQRFKPLALWSGMLRSDGNGEVQVPLDIPEFNGEIRLMAVAYKHDRFGSAQRPMKVADPVIITPALPRFVAPNDSIIMPITAFNTTDKSVKLSFSVETAGGLEIVSKAGDLEIGPNREQFTPAVLRATNQIGKAVVTVKTSAFGETITSTTELPVRPTSPFSSEAITGAVEGGKSAAHSIEDVYLPFGRKSFLTLSPFPVANFARELKFLVGYPYGCIEQTVSKAFPQVYLRDIAAVLDPSIIASGSPTYFVNEAITRVTSMQLPDGSFSYWPGSPAANNWATVYATHFLVEAKKAGYAVQEATLNSALNAILRIARSKLTEDYYSYGPGQRVVVKRIADKSAIYALYILAMAGKPEKSLMNFYRTERSLLTGDTQYLLAGAFILSGDRQTYLQILPPEFITEQAQRESGGNFDSPIRANAIILNVLLESDLNSPKIPLYMEYLSKTYQGNPWYSTQDNAFTLLAFGKAARMAMATKVTGTVTVGGKQFAYQGGNQKIDIDPYGKQVGISMNGEGRVYYSLVTEGIRTDGKVRTEDKNLQIRREFFNRFGQPVSLTGVKQNDLIVVKLTLNSSVDRLQYIAISDLLPAGFEIENPRIMENTLYPFIKDATSAEYLDIRDDRLNLFTSVRGNRIQHFYYMVRAVTAGSYVYAPVVAEAMYDANYYSASGGGKVSIKR